MTEHDPFAAAILAALDVGLEVRFYAVSDLRLLQVVGKGDAPVRAQQEVGHVRSTGELATIVDQCAAEVLSYDTITPEERP